MLHRQLIRTTTLTLAMAAMAAVVAAANPQAQPAGSPAFGVTDSQSVRISFVNSTDRYSGIVPCVCPVLLRLLDAEGNLLASEDLSVEPGAIGSATFDLRLRTKAESQMRALVDLTGSEGERLACHMASRSGVETVDLVDGRTSLWLPIVTTFVP